MACESLVSQVQHPSNQALKQAVTTNCQLSKVIPLHLTIALAAASACTHARRQVCLRKRVQKKTSMRHRNTYSQCAAGAERYCMLCRQRHFAHMHVHAPHCSRACWPSCGRAKKRQLTKNSSHCDRSTDIYSLVAQSCPAAYSCVCACHNRKSKRGDSSFLRRVHLTKTGSSVKMLQSARHWAVAMTTIKAWRPANKQLGCSEALKKQSPHTHSPHATQVYDHKSICVQCVASSLDVSNVLEMICCTPEVHVISLRS